WYQGGEGFSIFVDSTVSFSGKRSLCIQRVGAGNFGVVTSSFPIEEARGKTLKYSGYIKTENVTEGYAGLWWRVDGASGTLNFDNMSNRGAKGTTDWKKYSIEFRIDDKLTNIKFGVLLPGNGKAWFDNLSIELDEKIYHQNEPEFIKLSLEQINWLNNNIATFKSAEPNEDEKELSFLKEMVGDAKIVALGEGTHGTSEFFKMKHRITKYLVEKMGFTVFAIEAIMPEARDVNNYVLKGIGNPKDVLAGLYFWTWNTHEVLDMLEWMREYNISEKGRVEFWGFDMQFPNVAIKNTLNFMQKYDSTYYTYANEKYKKITAFNDELLKLKPNPGNILFEPYLGYAKDVYNHLIDNIDKYNSIASKDSTEWYIQNSRIVVQSLEARMQKHQSRDESMAINIQWIINHMAPNTKIILWAHNGHVSKKETNFQPMGAYLNKVYDNDMVVMGFGFNKGEYTAVGQKGLGIYSTSISEPGSVEWIMHRLNYPRLFLDLRKIKNSQLSNIFNSELEFRSIGARAMDYAFYKTVITDEFDILIYFENTTPSNCFGLTYK
ncbi:MAG: erythromycin esterase family protein, partial [Melioribacteraceae bacterium]|nr:erythromycin esterase family protein [Melioribacteraceae bacterium]